MLGIKDPDHLAARLHGRRARLADGARLRALCGLGSQAALARALFPGEKAVSSAQLQGRLTGEFITETMEIAACLEGPWARFAGWQAAWFQLENLKAALRGVFSGCRPDSDKKFASYPARRNGGLRRRPGRS